jgi:hypothetical protein
LRRALLIAGTTLVVVLALEATGWLGLLVTGEGLPSYRALERERMARVDGVWGVGGGEDLERRGGQQVARALHPYLGWVRDADADDLGTFGVTDPEAREYGFPTNPVAILQPADPGKLVVAVLGGSFAASLVRDAGDVLAAELAAQPRFAGREPLVLSLALPGFKQPQQLMTLAWFLALGAHFDLVINLDGYNELVASMVNWEAHGVFPAYPKRWYERVSPLDRELRLAVGESAWIQELRAERARWFSRGPLRRSFLAGLLWRLQDRDLEGRLVRAQARMGESDSAARYAVRGPRLGRVSEGEVLDEVVALWARSSRELDALARSAGADYHHFLQPNQYLDGTKPWSPQEERRARQTGTRRAEIVVQGYAGLRREGARLAASGLAFHDLTGLFAGVEETLYVDACCHVNRSGSRLVARAIAGAVGAAAPLSRKAALR